MALMYLIDNTECDTHPYIEFFLTICALIDFFVGSDQTMPSVGIHLLVYS